MQVVFIGENLHVMSNPVSGKNMKNILNCHLLKILPRVLSELLINSKQDFKVFFLLILTENKTSNFIQINLNEMSSLIETILLKC